MHWVTWVKPPPGFKPGSPDWEADDLPTELSSPHFHIVLSLTVFLEKFDTQLEKHIEKKWEKHNKSYLGVQNYTGLPKAPLKENLLLTNLLPLNFLIWDVWEPC